MSDVSFSVPAPTLTVSAPNTNVAWAVGTTQAIRWNHNLGTLKSMRIEIARDGVNYSETVLASSSLRQHLEHVQLGSNRTGDEHRQTA